MVVLPPVPVNEDPVESVVNVQVPVTGKPISVTLPVDNVQPGWIIVPATGAAGEGGALPISTRPDNAEVHPNDLVTL